MFKVSQLLGGLIPSSSQKKHAFDIKNNVQTTVENLLDISH